MKFNAYVFDTEGEYYTEGTVTIKEQTVSRDDVKTYLSNTDKFPDMLTVYIPEINAESNYYDVPVACIPYKIQQQFQHHVTQRTCDIVMICKGNYNYCDYISVNEAIKRYLAEECGITRSAVVSSDIDFELNEAFADVVKNNRNAQSLVRDLVERTQNNCNVNVAIMRILATVQIMSDSEYINGFDNVLITTSRNKLAKVKV